MRKTITTICITILLISCNVGPNYITVTPKTKSNWHASKSTQRYASTNPIQLEWWTTFDDPLLNRYIQEAFKANLDIKIAETRICQARAVRLMDLSNFYPKMDGVSNTVYQQVSKGLIAGFTNNSPIVNTIDRSQIIYNVGFDAQWELDLFGKNRRTMQVNQANIEQTQEARRKILLSTLAEIARSYIELRGAQHQMSLALQSTKLQEHLVNITKEQCNVGTNNAVNLASTTSQLNTLKATLPTYNAKIRANAYQIAVLLGQDPEKILKDIQPIKPLPIVPKHVAIGLRSDVLRQRPDVRESERKLASAMAAIGVAEADFFPKFSLIGNSSYLSTSFDNLFNASSISATLGPSINWPIFHAGKIRANVIRKQSEAEQAAYEYKKTILGALQDAETALERYGQALISLKYLQDAYLNNKQVVVLTSKRFKEGEDDRIALLKAKQLLLNSTKERLNADIEALIQVISLYKALGGGWKNSQPSQTI